MDSMNWLRVVGATERAQVAQRLCQHLHARVSLLEACTSQPPPLARLFPGQGPFDTHPYRMDGFVEEACAFALGRLSVAGMLGAVGDHAGIAHARAVVCGITAAIEVRDRRRCSLCCRYAPYARASCEAYGCALGPPITTDTAKG